MVTIVYVVNLIRIAPFVFGGRDLTSLSTDVQISRVFQPFPDVDRMKINDVNLASG